MDAPQSSKYCIKVEPEIRGRLATKLYKRKSTTDIQYSILPVGELTSMFVRSTDTQNQLAVWMAKKGFAGVVITLQESQEFRQEPAPAQVITAARQLLNSATEFSHKANQLLAPIVAESLGRGDLPAMHDLLHQLPQCFQRDRLWRGFCLLQNPDDMHTFANEPERGEGETTSK